MEDKRKEWIQPQLVVLGRGTPEESVLMGCKMTTRTVSGPGSTRTNCKKRQYGTNCNSKCQNLSTTS